MRKYLLILGVILAPLSSFASHLVGGYISYTYLGRAGSGYNYRVSIWVYRDCTSDVDYDDKISVCFYEAGGSKRLYSSETFNLVSHKKVQPVGRTDCPELASVCLEQGLYEKTVQLASNQYGYHVKWIRCCRNKQVNLPNDAQGDAFQGQTYLAFIPRTDVRNSSPTFADIPVPFICRGDTTEIRNRAVDPDGDSLVYKLVRPYTGGQLGNAAPDCDDFYSAPGTVIYTNGTYSQTTPFGTGGVSNIDQSNGLLTFKAMQTGNYAVAIDVEEWRNGKLLSTVRLDLQILVINCKPNNKPKLSPNLSPNPNYYEIQAGKVFCIPFNATDQDNNNITMKAYGDMFTGANGWTGNKATMATASGRGSASSTFCWKPECNKARTEPYTFTVEVVDDGCPSKFINVNYQIRVKPFVSNVKISGPVQICQNAQGATYTASGGQTGSRYNWYVTGGSIVSGNGTSSIKVNWRNGTAGIVTLIEKSADSCDGAPIDYPVTLIAAPPKPDISGNINVCLNANSVYTVTLAGGNTVKWIADAGTIIGADNLAAVTVFWNRKGTGFVSAVVTNSTGCSSPADTLFVTVHHPDPGKIAGPVSVCPNNKGFTYSVISGSGNNYQWIIEGGVQSGGGNSASILVDWGNPGTGKVKLLVTDQYGCKSDTAVLPVVIDYQLEGQAPWGDTIVCEFTNNVSYRVVPVTNSTFNWTVSGGTITSGQGTDHITVNWGASGWGSVSVQETSFDPVNKKACLSAIQTLTVRIAPVPGKLNISGIFEVCQQNDSGTYLLSGGLAGSKYQWDVNGSDQLIGQGSNRLRFPWDTDGSFRMRVIETSQYGCSGPLLDTVLVVHPKPLTSAINGSDVICMPDLSNYGYSVTGFPGSTYRWFISGGTFNGGNTGTSVNVNWSGQQYSRIQVIETSRFGCVGDTVSMDVFIDDPSISLRVVTVNPPPGNDRSVIIRWDLINSPRNNSVFTIEKRAAGSGGAFSFVGTAPSTATQYIESNINTDIQAWEYRVKFKNLCGREIISGNHTDILLTGTKPSPLTVNMNFSAYLGWNGGVDRYELYRFMPGKGGWTLYNSASSPGNFSFDNGLDNYTQCYRIKAIELAGNNEESWSNEICFNFDPVVFIPSAFSPNGDGKNDRFTFMAASVKTFSLQIFNRWGELLWKTDKTESSWDGQYLNKTVPDGVYVYTVTYTDFSNKEYKSKGTITCVK